MQTAPRNETKAPAASELAAAAETARTALAEAEAELTRLEGGRHDFLLGDDDAALERHDAAIAAARRRRDRAAAQAEDLERRHAEAVEREVLATAHEAHEDLRRRRDALAAELARAYPHYAGALADLIGRLAKLEREILGHKPPPGAEHIPTIERTVRRSPGSNDLVRSLEDTVKLPGLMAHERDLWPPFIPGF